jgi:hypothetical protein
LPSSQNSIIETKYKTFCRRMWWMTLPKVSRLTSKPWVEAVPHPFGGTRRTDELARSGRGCRCLDGRDLDDRAGHLAVDHEPVGSQRKLEVHDAAVGVLLHPDHLKCAEAHVAGLIDPGDVHHGHDLHEHLAVGDAAAVTHDGETQRRRRLIGEDFLDRQLNLSAVGDDDGQGVVGSGLDRSGLGLTASGEPEARGSEHSQEQDADAAGLLRHVNAFLVWYSSNDFKVARAVGRR